MPFFKTTYSILTKQDDHEVFDPNWFDSDTVVLPPKTKWSYDREMQIEDVDIWEILHESNAGRGIYAAYSPYAEFYLVTIGNDYRNPQKIINGFNYLGREWEVYYGPGAQQQVFQRAKELDIPLAVNKTWVDPDDMWLHQPQDNSKIFMFPNNLKI